MYLNAISDEENELTFTEETVDKLLTTGADVNIQNKRGSCWSGEGYETAFMKTTSYHYQNTPSKASVVQKLIDAGADVKLKDINGHTALMFLVECNPPDTDILEMLTFILQTTWAKQL